MLTAFHFWKMANPELYASQFILYFGKLFRREFIDSIFPIKFINNILRQVMMWVARGRELVMGYIVI